MAGFTRRDLGIKSIQFRDGFGTVVFLLTMYMTSIFAFSGSRELNRYSHILFFVAFGSCVLYLFYNQGKAYFSKYMMYCALFILWGIVTMLWAKDSGEAFQKVVTMSELLIASIILFSFLVSVGRIEFFIISIFASGLMGVAYVLSYYGYSEYIKMLEEGERAGAEISNVNTLGLYMAVTVVIGFYYAYIKRKMYYYALIVLPLVVALGSGSRKVLIILASAISVMIILDSMQRFEFKRFLRICIIIVLLIFLGIWVSKQPIFQMIFDRFEQMIGRSGKIDDSTRLRRKMIVEGMKYFKEHPFTGVGIGNSGVITEKFWLRSYLHNNFVELLACTGIVGFVLYYGMYFSVIVSLLKVYLKARKSSNLLLIALLVSQRVIEYGAVLYYDKMNIIYLTVAAADLYITSRELKEQKIRYL